MTIWLLLFALAMWFLGTAAIVWLDSRARDTFRTSLAIAGVVAIASLALVWLYAGEAGPLGAYLGFGAAILIWGWHEMSFLMGEVSGPNRDICPPGAVGVARFKAAAATLIYHELAIAATAIVLFAITWGEPNQSAPHTFLLLFVMRLSAQFNLYLGVPNLSDEVFPEHLAYLKSYFGTARINALFPVSILGGIAFAIHAWLSAQVAPVGGGAATSAYLVSCLAMLGVVEHLLLVIPVRDAKMFRWAANKTMRTETIERVGVES